MPVIRDGRVKAGLGTVYFVNSTTTVPNLPQFGTSNIFTVSGLNLGNGIEIYSMTDSSGVDSSFTLEFKTLISGSNILITDNATTITIDSTGGGSVSNTISSPIVFAFSGMPVSGQQVSIPIATQATITANFSGSVYFVGIPPSASVNFEIDQYHISNTVITNIGTLTVFSNGTVNAIGNATTLNIGDALIMFAPSPQDSSLQNISFTILSTRLL